MYGQHTHVAHTQNTRHERGVAETSPSIQYNHVTRRENSSYRVEGIQESTVHQTK